MSSSWDGTVKVWSVRPDEDNFLMEVGNYRFEGQHICALETLFNEEAGQEWIFAGHKYGVNVLNHFNPTKES